MRRPFYKEIRNFLINELKITKEDVLVVLNKHLHEFTAEAMRNKLASWFPNPEQRVPYWLEKIIREETHRAIQARLNSYNFRITVEEIKK